MYLNLADYDMVKNMYKKLKSENLAPNQMYLNSVLEASMRTDDADIIYDALNDFVNIKREPHKRLISKLNNIKHIPDRIYVVLKEHFGWSGQMKRRTREFEKPSFRQKSDFTPMIKTTKGKRLKPKKMATNQKMKSKDRRSVNVVL